MVTRKEFLPLAASMPRVISFRSTSPEFKESIPLAASMSRLQSKPLF
jgi:hypothetical protein